MTQSCLQYFAPANPTQSEKFTFFSSDHSMEERHRHCTKFVTRGGYIEIFLLFDTASVVVSVSIAATKCHSSMLSKTQQRSVVVFSLLRFCAL